VNAPARQKLIEAIVFFARNTRACGKIKLFKLLYMLDFQHFAATGRAVTGLVYQAWDNGPVPRVLYDEWLDPEDDLASATAVQSERVIDFMRERVVPQRAPDISIFTPRELQLLEALAERYRNHTASEMVDATHGKGSPWHRIWNEGEGRNQIIPYDLALIGVDPDVVAAIEERKEFFQIAGHA
jgi:uncharacterized phage-associated protein